MSVLEMAISCFKVVPAFGLLLFLHQSSSHETLISVVGCLFPPQGSNAEYLQPLKGFEMLPFWSGHCLSLGMATAWSIPLSLSYRTTLGPWYSSTVLLTLALSSVKLCHVIWYEVTHQVRPSRDEVLPLIPPIIKLSGQLPGQRHSLYTQKWNLANFTFRNYFLCWMWQYKPGGKQSSSRHR